MVALVSKIIFASVTLNHNLSFCNRLLTTVPPCERLAVSPSPII